MRSSLKDMARRACSGLAPVVTYLVSPKVGAAVSAAAFTAWLIKRFRGSNGLSRDLEREESSLIDLAIKLRSCRSRELMLRELMSDGVGAEALTSCEAELRILEEEFMVKQLRINALRIAEALGNPRVWGQVKELSRAAEKGSSVEDAEVKLVNELRGEWVRRQLMINSLRRVLSHA